MDDLISRQGAIDALGEAPKYKQRIIKTYAEGRNDQWFDDVTKISLLPPAQPEIIRCKDCWYWDKRGGRMYCEEMYFDQDDPDFYCGYAERRTDE